MTIPFLTYNGRTYTYFTVEQLLESGVPQAAIDAAILGLRVGELKLICRARIYAKASAETQSNMTFTVAFVGSKTASQRSQEEAALLAKAPAVLDWVNAMKANVAALAADPSLDPNDDANWPQPSQDALDLVAMF